MTSGIYQILINNKGYIGSTNNFKRRKNEHFSLLSRNKHCNKKLQNYYNKYNDVEFRIIVECCEEDLEKMENFYIKNSNINTELNIKEVARGGFLIGENHKRSKITEEKAIEIINLLNIGNTCLEVSNTLNISYYIVNGIKNKITWKHLSYLLKNITDRDQVFINLCKEGYYYRHCLLQSGLKENRAKELFLLYSNNSNFLKRPNRKYTFETMQKIREQYHFGKNISQLSKEYGINEGTIYLTVNNKIYKR